MFFLFQKEENKERIKETSKKCIIIHMHVRKNKRMHLLIRNALTQSEEIKRRIF